MKVRSEEQENSRFLRLLHRLIFSIWQVKKMTSTLSFQQLLELAMVTLRAAPLSIKLPHLRVVRRDPKLPMKFPAPAKPSLLLSNQQQEHQHPIVLNPPANQSVAAILLGDGNEAKLWPLTKRRSAAAIPIAAKYRLIDAVVSNCINSNITKIYALTQFNSTSLNSHLSRAYTNVGLGKDGFVEVIAAYQSPDNHSWFQGNADAVRRCLGVLEDYPVTEFLILPGHHLYRMDYQKLIQSHRINKADITISALKSIENQDRGFGILEVNSENQVLQLIQEADTKNFMEKSEESQCLPYSTFASMGIYVVNKDVMLRMLREYFPAANDFRTEVIPGIISLGIKVHAYTHEGYWANMGSIKAFYEASMDSRRRTNMGYNFSDTESPIYTMPRCLPPTRVTDSVITDSVIGEGCILNRCRITGSVLGLRTRIMDKAVVEDSIVMGSDIYQDDLNHNSTKEMQLTLPIGIGEGSYIRKAIIDKNARIGKGVMIINKDNVEEGNREADGYCINEGIIIVLKSAIIPDGSIL